MGYVSIATKLVELLEEITEIQAVYNHEPAQIASYPSASVQAVGHRNRFGDLAANERVFSFLIRLYYRAVQEQDAETILRDATDRVIAKLESNVNVPGVWDIARPTNATWRWAERETDMRIVEITIDIEHRVNR